MRHRLKRFLTQVLQLLLGRTRAAELLLARHWFNRNQYYDLLTDEIMARCIPCDAVCVDVGCHAGSMLRTMMDLAPAGRHLAFEPLPDFYARLVRDFTRPNVILFNVALSNQNATTTFKHVVTRPAFSGLQERSYEGDKDVIHEIPVQTRTLDVIVAENGLERLDFIKIDVEGAERLVLEGARATLARFKPTLVFECGLGAADYYGTKPEQIFDLLADCGLKISLLAEFLHGRSAMSREIFSDQFNAGRNYFFVAHR